MKTRLNYAKAAPGVYDAMDSLDQYLAQCGLERGLILLVQLRASQINGCAYCLDMHWKDLRAIGEGEQRLYSLDAWRECPYYTERERAALAWTEAVTLIHEGQAPDTIFDQVRPYFSEKELLRFDSRGGGHQCLEPPVDRRPAGARQIQAGPGLSPDRERRELSRP